MKYPAPSKRILGSLVLAGLLLSAVPANAEVEVSGNVALTTDYIFRGISQTNEDPAVQGGFDLSAGKFYIGTWGSNVEFGSAAHVELDLYLGFATELENGLSLDIGVIDYLYPSETSLDFLETYFGWGFKVFSMKYSYSDNFAGTGDAEASLEAGTDFELGERGSFGLHVGQTTFGDAVGLEDYIDYSLSLGVEANGFEFALSFHDTDIDNEPLAEGRVVLTISRSL